MTATPDTLLAADLDGTLIPTIDTPAQRRAVSDFRDAVEGARASLGVAYVTGRHLELAHEGITAWALPLPDFLMCDVGTSVYRRTGDHFEADPIFAGEMRAALGGRNAGAVRAALSGLEGLTLQGETQQSDFKASFTFPWSQRSRISESVSAALSASRLPVDLVTSRDPETGLGLLDALPAGGAKDRAVLYVARLLNLTPDQVIFAGDSGNDEAALLSGVRGVLVGNASEEVRASVRAKASRLGLSDRVYLASGTVAAGVLEGLSHFGVWGD
ncbi:MAG: HAD family hydrolase [Gemmatimonadetes bacterium]|nr:HAD family hydrolase [Gemmatimonadota bacterium]